MQLPLSIILDHAFKLIDLASITESFELQMILKQELDMYLESSGWTESEFDLALLQHINTNWTQNIN